MNELNKRKVDENLGKKSSKMYKKNKTTILEGSTKGKRSQIEQ